MKLSDWFKQTDKRLVFRHTSPYKLSTLRPLSYKELKESRSSDMPENELSEYMNSRIKTERVYHRLLPDARKEFSFLYTTPVGFHKMESSTKYPGFTYYFVLSEEQLENCIFEVVDFNFRLAPARGKKALIKALNFWLAFQNQMQPSPDSWFEQVDPRIEVIIPFNVTPFAFTTEIENRPQKMQALV